MRGHGARGTLRAVSQTPSEPDRTFGLFTESRDDSDDQVNCSIYELRVQSDGDPVFTWTDLSPRCRCGRPMQWVVRSPNQPLLFCDQRGPRCIAHRQGVWHTFAWRCQWPDCNFNYREVCRGCVPRPSSGDEGPDGLNHHFGFDDDSDKCRYSMVVMDDSLWVFVCDCYVHEEEVVWKFNLETCT